jgi:hypothetical protein
VRRVGVVVGAAHLSKPGGEETALRLLRIGSDEVDVAGDTRGRVGIERRDLGALDDEQRPLDGCACAREVRPGREGERCAEPL